MMSGDWVPLELVQRLQAASPDAELVSLGGATEASIWSIAHEIATLDAGVAEHPVRHAAQDQSCMWSTAAVEHCPDWVIGEIEIARRGRGARLLARRSANGGALPGRPAHRRTALSHRRSRPLPPAGSGDASSSSAARTSRSRFRAIASSWARSRQRSRPILTSSKRSSPRCRPPATRRCMPSSCCGPKPGTARGSCWSATACGSSPIPRVSPCPAAPRPRPMTVGGRCGASRPRRSLAPISIASCRRLPLCRRACSRGGSTDGPGGPSG